MLNRRRYVIGGLIGLYLVAAAAAIWWQLRPESWDPVLEPYVAFVEEERGLTFDEAVKVRWSDISAELEEGFAEERLENEGIEPSADPVEEAYALLGLIDLDPEDTLGERIDDTAAREAFAFYDPVERTIVLPEGANPEELGYTIVHELTHALQDQHRLLDWRLESIDSANTRTTLIEGDAERIAAAWFDQLDETEREQYFDSFSEEQQAAVEERFEDVGNSFFETSFEASYAIGLPAVEVIVEREGRVGIDRILRSKDVGTSERLLDVLTDSPRPSVAAFDVLTLPEDVDFVDGDIGAVTWFRSLAPIIGTEKAFDALVGYDDDAFVMLDRGADRCGRFVVSFNEPEDAEEFAMLAGDAMPTSTMNGLFVDEADDEERAVEFEICSPIGSPQSQRLGTILPLVVANEMALAHLRNGVPVAQARCASLAQAATIPADEPLDQFIGWETLDGAADGFLQNCDSAAFSTR